LAAAFAVALEVPAPPARPRSAALTGGAGRPSERETGIYIVGSAAQAAELRTALASAGQETIQAVETTAFIADPTNAGVQRQLAILFEDYVSGVLQNVRVIDLRTPAE
jgi:hypothetical protein